MIKEIIFPLVGLLITVIVLTVFYFSKYIQIHRGYEVIKNPLPRIYTADDEKELYKRYWKICGEISALQKEGQALRDYLSNMKQLATLVDSKIKHLDEENEIFRSAYTVFTRICKQKREVEIRARYQQNLKKKFQQSQIKILQLLPRKMFFSSDRLFLPPSPLNRISILINRIKALRGMTEQRSRKGAVVKARKRCLVPSQLHYYKRQQKERMEAIAQESLDGAKMRIRSIAPARI